MNKTVYIKSCFLIASALIALTFTSCIDDKIIEESSELSKDQESPVLTYDMVFNGNILPYDTDTLTTRAARKIKDGAKLYILFKGSNGQMTGTGIATYSMSKDTWSISTSSNLDSNVSAACEVAYFEGEQSVSGSKVKLNSSSMVFYEMKGKWIKQNQRIIVAADLTPYLGRIRFEGSNGTKFSLSGITTLASYDLQKGSFVDTLAIVEANVGSEGKSGYIYGRFTDEDNPSLSIMQNNVLYQKLCSNTIYKKGQSGFITLPTGTASNGWNSVADINKTGDESNHPYVDLGLSCMWATFNVGATKPEECGNYYAWGDTVLSKTEYNWNGNYKWGKGDSMKQKFKKYFYDASLADNGCVADDNRLLELSDDPANCKWGGYWRTPTQLEWEELMDKCVWTWFPLNGMNGYFVTGPNKHSVFLPAAGYFRDKTSGNNKGGYGYYSSSVLYTNANASSLLFYDDMFAESTIARCYGTSVRPVFFTQGKREVVNTSIDITYASEQIRVDVENLIRTHLGLSKKQLYDSFDYFRALKGSGNEDKVDYDIYKGMWYGGQNVTNNTKISPCTEFFNNERIGYVCLKTTNDVDRFKWMCSINTSKFKSGMSYTIGVRGYLKSSERIDIYITINVIK